MVSSLLALIFAAGLRLGPLLVGWNPPPPGSNQWFKDGLSFGCTGCGKCCQMDGDVWLSPEEQPLIASALGETVDTFRAKYTRQILKEWVCLSYYKSPPPPLPLSLEAETTTTPDTTATVTASASAAGGCIFLSTDGKCGIYETRPVQCRTYPFWPSLLSSPDDWEEEAVAPDDAVSDDRKRWTLEEGGCEGIHHIDAPLVPADEIELKRREARDHWRRFPDRRIKHDTWYL